MGTNKTYYRRNLPHYQPEGYTFFITFRLTGSLPINVIERLKAEYKNHIKDLESLKSNKEKQSKYLEAKWNYFEKFDSFLDKYSNNNFLKNEVVARLVYDSILFRDRQQYNLICFCIMPNHVHTVFTPVDRDLSRSQLPTENVDRDLSRFTNNIANNSDINVALQFPIVTNILRLLKGSTARECNKILNRTGAFWQHESYDHVIRSEDELNRIIEYILNNPVRAKLVDNADEWKWSYCKYL